MTKEATAPAQFGFFEPHDPLEFLPFRPERSIRERGVLDDCLMLINTGRVMAMVNNDDGSTTIIELYGPGDLIGNNCGMLSEFKYRAITPCTYVAWTRDEVAAVAATNPGLATALYQSAREHQRHYIRRLRSTLTESIYTRLVRSLLNLSTRFNGEDGTMPSYTHELLASYIGTSREIVTHYMNDLRRKGFIRYDRRMIWVDAAELINCLESYHERA